VKDPDGPDSSQAEEHDGVDQINRADDERSIQDGPTGTQAQGTTS